MIKLLIILVGVRKKRTMYYDFGDWFVWEPIVNSTIDSVNFDM